jgi:Rrf2 family protein
MQFFKFMRFSTRSEYALRAVIELAQNGNEASLSVSTIAQRTGIPHQYLEQLIHHLRRGGLVTAFRGVKGGYRLSRKPGEISIGEILRCMEGDLAPYKCPVVGPYTCPRAATCLGKNVWSEIASAVNRTVDGMTVAALIAKN